VFLLEKNCSRFNLVLPVDSCQKPNVLTLTISRAHTRPLKSVGTDSLFSALNRSREHNKEQNLSRHRWTATVVEENKTCWINSSHHRAHRGDKFVCRVFAEKNTCMRSALIHQSLFKYGNYYLYLPPLNHVKYTPKRRQNFIWRLSIEMSSEGTIASDRLVRDIHIKEDSHVTITHLIV